MSYSITKTIQQALNKGYHLTVISTAGVYTIHNLPKPTDIGNILEYRLLPVNNTTVSPIFF